MATRNRLKEIEREQGKPISDLILPLVNSGGQKKAAQELGTTQATISLWLKTNGYVRKQQYVKEGA